MALKQQIDQPTKVNLDLIQKLESVSKEAKELSTEIETKQERLKALNKLGRQYVALIKAAEALEEHKPETKIIA